MPRSPTEIAIYADDQHVHLAPGHAEGKYDTRPASNRCQALPQHSSFQVESGSVILAFAERAADVGEGEWMLS